MSFQPYASVTLPPGKKSPLLIEYEAGRAQSRSGRVRKITPPLRFDPQTAQSVANLYTDRAILADVLIRFQA